MPTRHASTRAIDMMEDISACIAAWAPADWEDPRDKMRLARQASAVLWSLFQLGWHTLPFTDSPDASTLLSVARGLVPLPSASAPVLPGADASTRGPALSVGLIHLAVPRPAASAPPASAPCVRTAQ